MMTIHEVTKEIGKKWPLSQAESFDNVGLLCGNPQRELTGILVCHDALEKVVEEAIQKKCNLIVSFHPIIFSGLKSITGKDYVEKTVLKAIENKIAIYAVHTALDNDYLGVNYGICEQLGLKNRKILMPKKAELSYLTVYVPPENKEALEIAIFDAGAGQIGDYDLCSFSVEGKGSFRPKEGAHPTTGEIGNRELVDEIQLSFLFESYKKNQIVAAMKAAHPYEEVAYQIVVLENENHFQGLGQYGDLDHALEEVDFLNFIKEQFQLKVIRHSELTNRKIKKVGVLGGSGASGIKAAIASGCDAYLSADFKYHDFFLAENKILLADIGHYESEQFVIQQLYEFLCEKFSKFAILKTELNTNPVNYFL